jgi:DNA-binding HxlR family transcriptional regulator
MEENDIDDHGRDERQTQWHVPVEKKQNACDQIKRKDHVHIVRLNERTGKLACEVCRHRRRGHEVQKAIESEYKKHEAEQYATNERCDFHGVFLGIAFLQVWTDHEQLVRYTQNNSSHSRTKQGGTILSDTHTDVPIESHSYEECRALADILMHIGDKWTVMVVGVLSQGAMRYNQIFKLVDGVSQRMLTLTLKSLERDGLVTRTMYPTIPPRVDYALTERGETLVVPLRTLWIWAQANRTAIELTRFEFDQRHHGEKSSLTPAKDGALRSATGRRALGRGR